MSKNHKWLKRNSNHFKHAHNNFHIFFSHLVCKFSEALFLPENTKILEPALV